MILEGIWSGKNYKKKNKLKTRDALIVKFWAGAADDFLIVVYFVL